jgi:glycosyltransferase involved in cell wall biosynthesis
MRIAIDARLNAYRQGGIPQYTRQLLTALAEVAHDDEFVSLQHRQHLRPLVVASNVTRRTVFTPPHHRFEQWTLPLEVMLARPDVLHCPDFIAPTRRNFPAVVTIHDLAFMHYPHILDDAARAYYGQIRENAARADAVIAVSEATRQDIAQFLDIPIENIAMIYEAAAPIFHPISIREGEARVLGSTAIAADSFMLFMSTLEPRKNIPTLLQALRICIDRHPERPYRLVLAGSRGWRDESIFETARDLKLGDHVLFVGSVGQYDLRWLYNACRFYINPSLYEGFGLPLLEAMACGAPCLAALTSSLPEIGGDAAIYVPPLEADLWADAIEMLWEDQDRRAELSRLGLAQAQRFSWQRAARETLQVYNYAVSGSGTLPVSTSVAASAPPPLRYSQPLRQGTTSRSCLRCNSLMQANPMQHGILTMPLGATEGHEQTTVVWVCTNCGKIELVAQSLDSHTNSESIVLSSNGHEHEAAQANDDEQNAEQTAQANDDEQNAEQAALANDDGLSNGLEREAGQAALANGRDHNIEGAHSERDEHKALDDEDVHHASHNGASITDAQAQPITAQSVAKPTRGGRQQRGKRHRA